MQIHGTTIRRYKSIWEATFSFNPGINVIVGGNNAGKSALLEALSPQRTQHPHRSSVTVPTLSDSTEQSTCAFDFSCSFEEWQQIEKRTGSFDVSVEADKAVDLVRLREFYHRGQSIRCVWEWPSGAIKSPTFGLYPTSGRSVHVLAKGDEWSRTPGNGTPIGQVLFSNLNTSMFRFSAERMNVGLSKFGSNRVLSLNAANLPEVLGVLQANTALFARFNSLVRRVFPHIEQVTIQPSGSADLRIMIWGEPDHSEREDLAVPLTESGTGIGQVLAMLYVVTNADPQVLLIDEPGSFLHPGAARALLEIFQENKHHQYIISTHSPELLAAANPSSVHLLRLVERRTEVTSWYGEKAKYAKSVLREVGARLSDVFGADHVLWVEGPTEEECFPKLIKRLIKDAPAGLVVVGVLNTGDFEAANTKNAAAAFRLYEKISEGPALVPPAVGFVFDLEERPQSKLEDLKRMGKGRVRFLPRRTFENFLVDAQAIAVVLNQHAPFDTTPTTDLVVSTWLLAHQNDPKYSGKGTPGDIVTLDAPRMLADLFDELSGRRLAYSKTVHSVELTDWLLEHKQGALAEVAALLEQLFKNE